MVADKPDVREGLAHEILNSALSGSLLTRRLLAVARNQPLRPERVDLVALLHSHVECCADTWRGDPRRGEASDRPLVHQRRSVTDRRRVLNLALNARDAIPQGGDPRSKLPTSIWMREARGRTQRVDRGRLCPVEQVADTGAEWRTDVLQRAMSRSSRPSRRPHGLGLGLSMAYGFAGSRVGASISKVSLARGPRSGCICRVRGKMLSAVTNEPKEAAPCPGGTEAILLVDDNQTLMSVARRQLRPWATRSSRRQADPRRWRS